MNYNKFLIPIIIVQLCFLLLVCCSDSFASSVGLAWDANTEADIGGYKIYYVADRYNFDYASVVDVGNVTTTAIGNLDPRKSYSFAAKAYNLSGMESAFSNVVSIDAWLKLVTNIRIIK